MGAILLSKATWLLFFMTKSRKTFVFHIEPDSTEADYRPELLLPVPKASKFSKLLTLSRNSRLPFRLQNIVS